MLERLGSLHNLLYLHGPTPHKVALRALLQCYVLINIRNRNSFQLHSKLLEYLYTEKHLLDIYTSEQDNSVELLRDYPFALSAMETAAGDAAEVAQVNEKHV